MALARGTRIRRYEIETLLGAGGMGEVYRARDVELDRTVALKILRHADERRFVQEARAVTALNHPHIAHLYDAGEEDGVRFMAMEYVEGTTLRARMPMGVAEAIEVIAQAAAALGAAHRAGIIHRDIKPENVMVRPDGYVKVLDFGLAKLESATSLLTAKGFTVGTVDYMSPEQRRGDPVDARTDIYALGVMLREMTGDAKPLRKVIAKATAPNRDDRYPTADAFIQALRGGQALLPVRPGMIAWPPLIALGLLIALFFFLRRTPPAPAPLPPRATESLTVTSTPPGARVVLERVTRDGGTEARTIAGTTPLEKFALARGEYVITVEKEGFAPYASAISLTPLTVNGVVIPPRPVALERVLVPRRDVPNGMVPVTGGRYRMAAWSRPSHETAQLDPFVIDRFEVSNREFAQFVTAGGYQRRELWKHPFVKDGRTLTFDEAMKHFRDATGLPGPRSWSGQTYPPGRDAYPVTHVTWYEAAAYAELRGKTLPTVYQWDKASRDGVATPFGPVYPWGIASPGVDILRRANFRGAGAMPVDSLRGGISPFGAYHMAGNVAEWCLNAIDAGFAVTGGAYDSAVYEFGSFASFPGFYASATTGFRCARVIGTPAGDQGGAPLSRNAPRRILRPAGDAEFRRIAALYDYEKTPLDARVIGREEADAWIVETIEFNGSGGQRTRARLFLPKHRTPPFQVLHFVPPGDVAGGRRPLQASIAHNCGAFVRAGRTAFGVELRGYLGRERLPHAEINSPEYAEAAALHVIDLRRGLDYLATRPDLDTSRIALFGPSAGGAIGMLLAAVDHRYRGIVMAGAGIHEDDEEVVAEARRSNFAPRIEGSKLMIQGRWDDVVTLAGEAQPLFDLLREPKRMRVVDAGHVPPQELFIPLMSAWLDETLGPAGHR